MTTRALPSAATAVAATLLAGSLIAVAAPAGAAPGVTFTEAWKVEIPGGKVSESSPLLVDLNADGVEDVVVGALNHQLYAFNGKNGALLWNRDAGAPVNSAPSAADVDGDGRPEIFVGSGYHSGPRTSDPWHNPSAGYLSSFQHDGTPRFRFSATDWVCHDRPVCGFQNPGVHTAPVLGDVDQDGDPEAVFGTMGLRSIWSVSSAGVAEPGFPFYSDDTIFSTPALADLDRDGVTDFVIGTDSTPGPSPVDHQGGIVRAMRGDGSQIWAFGADEIIRSSPAVGDVDGDGQPEVVVGTGDYWNNPAYWGLPNVQPGYPDDDTKVFVLDGRTGRVEQRLETGGVTLAAPALGDVNGDGRQDVVIGTIYDPAGGTSGGKIRAFDGKTGASLMNTTAHSSVREGIYGGVALADMDGDGRQDVLAGTGSGLYIRSGNGGGILSSLGEGQGRGYHNTPAVSDVDRNGRLDVIAAGHKGTDGFVIRYASSNSNGAVTGSSWPTFHKDARRTGNVSAPPLRQTPPNLCEDVSPDQGYWMVARDGGVFAFCGAKFHGSAGNVKLAQPIVASAPTPSGKGYWLFAADGGVFNYGDAKFHGSAGNLRLAKPIVAAAATPTGKGYWLVASDGGVFTYGDAKFLGSAGNLTLTRPIVAGAATPTGKGYWLFASDGGVFTYGDAKFHGSAGNLTLAKPIVTSTPTPTGKGYWLVASDGGVFTYGDATFQGSAGSLKLAQPIVTSASTSSGSGYWLFASDGGVFSYGDAEFMGSLGRLRLNQPIVTAMTPDAP